MVLRETLRSGICSICAFLYVLYRNIFMAAYWPREPRGRSTGLHVPSAAAAAAAAATVLPPDILVDFFQRMEASVRVGAFFSFLHVFAQRVLRPLLGWAEVSLKLSRRSFARTAEVVVIVLVVVGGVVVACLRNQQPNATLKLIPCGAPSNLTIHLALSKVISIGVCGCHQLSDTCTDTLSPLLWVIRQLATCPHSLT